MIKNKIDEIPCCVNMKIVKRWVKSFVEKTLFL